jgi:hypothetical protein
MWGNTLIQGHGFDGNKLVMEWEHTDECDITLMNVEWEPTDEYDIVCR